MALRKKMTRRIRGRNKMVYLIVCILSVLLWFAFTIIAKLIDLSNKNKEWYKALQKRLEEEQ